MFILHDNSYFVPTYDLQYVVVHVTTIMHNCVYVQHVQLFSTIEFTLDT